ncbi:MAG TPA: hypothetical protein VGA38_07450 [Candidatus Limnocylindria bacterium]
MPWGTFAIEWVHILLGIFWFGSALYANFILAPVVIRLGPSVRRELLAGMVGRAPVLVWAGYLTVTAGLLRGTVFGRIQSTDVLFGTRYGVVWLAALGVGIFLALWSHLVLWRSARRMIAMPPPAAASGPVVASRPDPLPVIVEMVGFVALFTLMIVLKFS